MRLVRNLNERTFNDLVEELKRCFDELSMKYVHFAPGAYPRPTSITIKNRKFPFPLAAELYEVYLYLIGEKARPSGIRDTLYSVCDMAWYNPFVNDENSFYVEWEKWEHRRLGYFIRCAMIAVSLEDGDSINSKQLSILAGISPTAVIKHIKEGKLEAQKVDREWRINAKDALSFLKLQFENIKGGSL